MSETLVGVVIGGLIASVGPVSQLIYGHFRWKRETKLQNLKERRDQLEARNQEFLREFGKAIFDEKWSPHMTSEIEIVLPEKARIIFYEYMLGNDKAEEVKRSVVHDVARELKMSVQAINNQIETLLD